MSKQQTHHAFITVAIIIMAAVAASIMVYAYILSTYYGGNVQVVTVQGQVWYCSSNSTSPSDWTATLSNVGNSSAWYAKFNTTSSGYNGAVTMTWTLQEDITGTWTDQSATQSTGVTLTGSAGQIVYASSDGSQALNKNWGSSTTTAGSYRIKVVMTKP